MRKTSWGEALFAGGVAIILAMASMAFDSEKLAVERQKLEVERQNKEIERNKLKVECQKREGEEKEKLAGSLQTQGDAYRKNVAPKLDRARNICRSWTGSACASVDDLRPFIEEYSRIRFIHKHTDDETYNQIPLGKRNDVRALEDFRKAGIQYWKLTSEYDRKPYGLLPNMSYPGRGERIEFLTSFWSIYKSNNICAERVANTNEQGTFIKVLANLEEKYPIDATDVKVFHVSMFPSFMKFHSANIEKYR